DVLADLHGRAIIARTTAHASAPNGMASASESRGAATIGGVVPSLGDARTLKLHAVKKQRRIEPPGREQVEYRPKSGGTSRANAPAFCRDSQRCSQPWAAPRSHRPP